MLKTNITSFISLDVGEIIQGGNYENFVNELMNKSKNVFPNEYKHIEHNKQYKGQADFIDLKTNETFDAKLFLTPDQGKDLGAWDKNIKHYAEQNMSLSNEITDCIENQTDIRQTLMYNTLKKLIDSTTANENVIIIFTFPFMYHISNSITQFIFADYLDIVYEQIQSCFNKRSLYFIYPTIDNKMVLRKMTNRFNEKINNIELIKCEEYFKYFRVINIK